MDIHICIVTLYIIRYTCYMLLKENLQEGGFLNQILLLLMLVLIKEILNALLSCQNQHDILN